MVIFPAEGALRLARPNTISHSGGKGKITALEFRDVPWINLTSPHRFLGCEQG